MAAHPSQRAAPRQARRLLERRAPLDDGPNELGKLLTRMFYGLGCIFLGLLVGLAGLLAGWVPLAVLGLLSVLAGIILCVASYR